MGLQCVSVGLTMRFVAARRQFYNNSALSCWSCWFEQWCDFGFVRRGAIIFDWFFGVETRVCRAVACFGLDCGFTMLIADAAHALQPVNDERPYLTLSLAVSHLCCSGWRGGAVLGPGWF